MTDAKKGRGDGKGAAGLEVADAMPPEFSDQWLARRFAAKHADDARYVAAWGRWLLWDGSRWRFDTSLRVFDLASGICRVAAAKIDPRQLGTAKALASAQTRAAVVNVAREDRRIAAEADQWDADPWLLNTPGGILDLRRGVTVPHDPGRYMTKITAVAPGGDCPLWRKFLAEITGGDAGLQAYLQRVAGYSLTGITAEHALFFCYGTGANGKSVFLGTLAGILGAFATTAPMTTFTASRNDQHPTDVAGLRGARLVVATETEGGHRWAEAKIKLLTGGDAVSARFMRGDFFEFVPAFKLLIAGNHKPRLRGVDEAMRRRLNLVPFNVTIPEGDRDTGLSDKLKAEWGGILSWTIDGCLEWQRIGLAPPEAVRDATDAYLAGEDALGQWLAERCDEAPPPDDYSRRHQEWAERNLPVERSAILFADWQAWGDAAGEFVGSQRAFSQALEARGYVRFNDSHTRQAMFRGLRLLPVAAEPDPFR